jgi:hypothetical protein
MPEWPCQYCRRHRGENGFRRLDHLRQHMRNYHHHESDGQPLAPEGSRGNLKYIFPVCSHADCPKYRGIDFQELPRSQKEADRPFASQSEYTKHMREEHEECAYPCDVEGCDRVGRRGYFREKDMLRHRSQQHPDALPYQVTKREMKHRCMEPGCNALLDLSSLQWHYQGVHGIYN